MNQSRILIVSAVFPPEQVTSASLNYDLAHELAKAYKVTVLRPYPTRPIGAKFELADIIDSSFSTILLDSYTHPQSSFVGRFRESIDFGRKAADYIKKHHEEIDFVYNDGWQLFSLYLVAKACVKYNIPYMVPIQDIYPESLMTKGHYPSIIQSAIKSVFLPMDTYYQRHAAVVRTISDEMAQYLSSTRKIDLANYLVVNNWQNDEDFEILPEKKDDDMLIFAYVGSINVHANVDLIIKSFVKANIPNSQLKIYGGGNQKEACQKLVADLGATNISFDFVSQHEIAGVQAQADVLVLALPAGNGNLCLPSKLTSYMLSGRPVIASVDQGSTIQRILEGEGCGFTTEPDNQVQLIKAFQKFSQLSIEKKEQMGMKSREFAHNHLTRKVNLDKVLKSIKQFLK